MDQAIILRDLQFIIRALPFMLLSIIFVMNYRVKSALIRSWITVTWFLLLLGAFQMLGQLFGFRLIPFASGRVINGYEQLTSIFSEPALYGMYLVAALFILFSSLCDLKKHKWLFLGIVLSIIVTQSLGALAGLLVWMVFFIKGSFSQRRGKTRVVIISAIVISLGVLFVQLVPNNRIAGFDPESITSIEDKYQARDAKNNSTQRRVVVELLVLYDFITLEGVEVILFGLSTRKSEFYREETGFVMIGDDVSGNGVVEYILRYGLFGLFLLVAFAYVLSKNTGQQIKFAIFAMLLAQIDGAIAKPYFFFYLMSYYVSLEDVMRYRKYSRSVS